MILCKWDKLPQNMQTEAVRPYYEALAKKTISLIFKRCFDVCAALILLIILSPVLLVLVVLIKIDSKGTVMFRQVRITQYGREFRIFKFRTMVQNAESLGGQITTKSDARVTRVGAFLRKCKLDELPQLLNIVTGDMSFVGTRPEVPRYVEFYTDEMRATLLLPAGVTSQASIEYKDENELIAGSDNVDETYVQQVLPAKMRYNLLYLMTFDFWNDIKIMLRTAWAVSR